MHLFSRSDPPLAIQNRRAPSKYNVRLPVLYNHKTELSFVFEFEFCGKEIVYCFYHRGIGSATANVLQLPAPVGANNRGQLRTRPSAVPFLEQTGVIKGLLLRPVSNRVFTLA
ncbi:hypothetical protein TNCV_2209071 [Trichonephila clavipes]|nr:hypothetical protein TNCV_2209071 [Trichonephila clavipes]